ncbi:MAG TPA: hypothetical protein VMM78_03940, partial [Thermomicrobiales bacterium]|nr:hypothetical protein [Thermomicrobiales bacterium]
VAVSGAAEEALSDTLERATEAHIVEELPRGDGFRFTHALIRETLYEGLGLLRRRSLHRAVGEALAASSRPDPDAVAHHLGQASDDRAFDWLIQAGDRAQRSYAWLIAAERYEQAAALIADDTERQREYGWLHVLIARMLRLSDTPRALGFVTDGARIGRDVGDCWLWLFGSMHVGYFQVLIGETRLGVQRLVEVGAEMEVAFRDGRLEGWTPPERLTLDTRSPRAIHRMARQHPNQPVVLARALECVHLAWSGRLREAESLGGRLTSVWSSNRIDEAVRDDALGLVSSWGDLYLALARVSDALGHPDESLERLDIATRAYAMIPHYVQMAGTWSMKMETLIAYRTEDISARRLAAEQAIANASKAVGASMEFQMAAFHRGLSLLEGHWHQARDLLSERHARVHDGPRWFGSQRESGVLAQLHRQMGSIDDAWRVINAFLPDGAATEPGDSQFYPALTLIHTAASLALDAKDAATGRAWLESHDRWLSWSGAVLGQVAGHLGWARCYRETGDLAAAEQHARTALSKASDPRQPLGLIAAHRLLGELASQRGAHAVAHEHLRESLSLAERCEAPYEIALTQTALAELCVAVGEGDTARDLLAAARATCERLGAAPHLTRIVTLEATIA